MIAYAVAKSEPAGMTCVTAQELARRGPWLAGRGAETACPPVVTTAPPFRSIVCTSLSIAPLP
jgi:hypothetical protein